MFFEIPDSVAFFVVVVQGAFLRRVFTSRVILFYPCCHFHFMPKRCCCPSKVSQIRDAAPPSCDSPNTSRPFAHGASYVLCPVGQNPTCRPGIVGMRGRVYGYPTTTIHGVSYTLPEMDGGHRRRTRKRIRCVNLLVNIWGGKKRNEPPNVGGVSIWSRNGAASRTGCVRDQRSTD